MDDIIKLGKITAPVGIKGELRVYPYTDTVTRFSDMEKVMLDGKEYLIQSARAQKNMAVLKLSGIDDRNAAELLRNKELYISREDMWEMPEDTYLVKDLLSCKVVDENGEQIGVLKEVIQNSSQDIYLIETPQGKQFMLPAVKEFVLDVDLDERIITVHLIEGILDL